MKNIKYIGYGTLAWMIIFLIDYIYELFQINESGIVTTLTGLRITTEMTPHELNTTFSLTFTALIIYIAFIIIWLVASNFIRLVASNPINSKKVK